MSSILYHAKKNCIPSSSPIIPFAYLFKKTLTHLNATACLAVLFLILTQQTSAQSEKLEFKRIGTKDGLSQNIVQCIVKDQKGFMWFGTRDGLNRYDGYKIVVYKNIPSDETTISDNTISDLLVDRKGNLWIATGKGLDRYDPVTANFIHYDKFSGNVSIHDLFEDSNGRLWIATNEGMFLYGNGKTFRNLTPAPEKKIEGWNDVNRIIEDREGNLWLAKGEGGLDQYNPKTNKVTHFEYDKNNPNSIASNFLRRVLQDSQGNIWTVAREEGLSVLDPRTNRFTNYRHIPGNDKSLAYNDVISLDEIDGRIWIGTDGKGLSAFDLQTKTFSTFRSDDKDKTIRCIYRDDTGDIWLGTHTGGVLHIPKHAKKFKVYRKDPFAPTASLSTNVIRSVIEDQDGDVWVGTEGEELNVFNRHTNKFTVIKSDESNGNSPASNKIYTMVQLDKDIIVFGYYRGGIDFYNKRTKTFTHYPFTELEKGKYPATVNTIFKDAQGDLWIGTTRGLVHYNKTSKTFKHLPDDDKNLNKVFAFLIDSKGNTWSGTEKGLVFIEAKTKAKTVFVNNKKDHRSISDELIHCIHEDKAGNIWIATGGGGLNLFNPSDRSFTVYREKDGLPSDVLFGILEDDENNLWISTSKGIGKFNTATKKCAVYQTGRENEENEFRRGAYFKNSKGEMYFGGIEGLVLFHPDHIEPNPYAPPVYITGFQIFNKPVLHDKNRSPLLNEITETKEITLSYKQSVFTLEFAALGFTSSEKNQYAYKMEGFDKDWQYVGNARTATYTNLDPGTYTFLVKASNNDGVWNEKPASIKIIITPPFWQTWWFRIVVITVVIGAVIAFVRLRIRSIKKQQLLLERQVAERTEKLEQMASELKQSVEMEHQARLAADEAASALESKNRELEQFAYVASHDLQEPLRTISSFVGMLEQQYKGKLDEKADKYISFIIGATDRMKVLITDLLEYSRIGRKKEKAKVDCNQLAGEVVSDLQVAIREAGAEVHWKNLPTVEAYPTEMKQLLQNLLVNAIKFRKKEVAPQVQITCERQNGHWKFSVRDNGIGIDPKHSDRIFVIFQRLHTRNEYEGSGIGLSNCKKIAELHGGKIWVESAPGEGSNFLFTIKDQLN
jgi:ligand-binding sensor domain-containing protein/signal transduction histidine kinase